MYVKGDVYMSGTTLYVHITPSNKYYIGITQKSVKKRWGVDGKGYYGQLFYRAIKKYGWNNIKHIILLENLDKEEAYECEKYLIAKYYTTDPKYGYNISYGGDAGQTGLVRNEIQKKHISDAHKGLPLTQGQLDNLKLIHQNNTGKHLSDEHKQKISEVLKGKKRSEESRKRISEAKKGHIPWNKGKPMSEETKEKLRQANLGNKLSKEAKQKISEANKGKRKGIHLSDETRRKISESNKGRIAPNKGKPMSDEAKKKLSASIKESLKNKDLSGANNGFYGKHHSPETIEKIRKANIERAAKAREEKLHGS